MHVILLGANIYTSWPVGASMIIGISVLIYYFGTLLMHLPRNWFVGFRTPWSLSNDNNWQRTNRLGGRLFRLCAVLAWLGLLWPESGIWIFISALIVSALIGFGYSFYLFRYGK